MYFPVASDCRVCVVGDVVMKSIKVQKVGQAFMHTVELIDIAGFEINEEGEYVLYCHDDHLSEYSLESESWIKAMRDWARYLKGIK